MAQKGNATVRRKLRFEPPPVMLEIKIFADKTELAVAAAGQAAALIRQAASRRGVARIVAATGTSQIDFLHALVSTPALPWPNVEMFHLDEYIGLGADHPASFRRYLLDRLISPTGLTRYHLIDGEGDPRDVCLHLGRVLASSTIDVAFVGIGENGHLAFNDPPADFNTAEPYIVVSLDEACRRQQVNEGWFSDLSEVPVQAISMSVSQLLRSDAIICVVPDQRKARAVKACLEGAITPWAPASILRTHPNTTVYLDTGSASLLASPSAEGHTRK